jgi:hypothetical protein
MTFDTPFIRRSAMRVAVAALAPLLAVSVLRGDAPTAPLFAQDFDQAPAGNPPEGIMVLNGTATVKKIDGNGVLEMSPDPLDSHGVLFGPQDKGDYTVSARVQAASTGKRFPEFGAGAYGPGQYRLWIMPAVGEVQLIKGEEIKGTAKYAWTSGAWTRLKLRVQKSADGKIEVEGKAWPDGKAEPSAWTLSFEDAEPPQTGRACLLSTPYSGQPTRFDDIVVAVER